VLAVLHAGQVKVVSLLIKQANTDQKKIPRTGWRVAVIKKLLRKLSSGSVMIDEFEKLISGSAGIDDIEKLISGSVMIGDLVKLPELHKLTISPGGRGPRKDGP